MLGLLKPQSGSVSVYDSASSCQASKRSRGNFRYVPQGNTLMSGTIRENLLLGDASATDDRLKEALHTAAADFVFELPDGWDSICGESGSGLSEGQCQRIAIARALLHRGGILLLDESTSSLDPRTESELLSNLRRVIADETGQKLTVIFISHREAVMASADELLRIE